MPSPLYHLRRALRFWRLSGYWKSLRHKHRGQRGFVIGNGPSLKAADVDRLQGEVAIASNKIYLIYDQTAWRPTYFTISDPIVWDKIVDDLHQHQPLVWVPHFLPYQKCQAEVRRWRNLGPSANGPNGAGFSDDLAHGVYGGDTVTFENLQLAVHLGLDPIYLIGCDHYYGGEEKIIAGTKTVEVTQGNHFHPNYREKGEVANVARIELMDHAYATAQAYAEAHGVRIYNATRGGYLEAFPRADFDEIAPPKS